MQKIYECKTCHDEDEQAYITHICKVKRPDSRGLIATGLWIASGTVLSTLISNRIYFSIYFMYKCMHYKDKCSSSL